MYLAHCKEKNLGTTTQRKFSRMFSDRMPMIETAKHTIEGKRMECWIGISFNENFRVSQLSRLSPLKILSYSKLDSNHFKKVNNIQTIRTIRTPVSENENLEKKKPLSEQLEQLLNTLKTLEKPMTEHGLMKKTGLPAEDLHRLLEVLQRDRVAFQPTPGYWRATQ